MCADFFHDFPGHSFRNFPRGTRGKSCWEINHIWRLIYFSFAFTVRTVHACYSNRLINYLINLDMNCVHMQSGGQGRFSTSCRGSFDICATVAWRLSDIPSFILFNLSLTSSLALSSRPFGSCRSNGRSHSNVRSQRYSPVSGRCMLRRYRSRLDHTDSIHSGLLYSPTSNNPPCPRGWAVTAVFLAVRRWASRVFCARLAWSSRLRTPASESTSLLVPLLTMLYDCSSLAES
jgi:hypothetical protein